MTIVTVATLKQKLSEYLHLVEKGEQVVVTSHRRPVARVVPEGAALSDVRVPSESPGILRKIRGVTVRSPGAAVQTLLRDRRRR